MKKILLGLIGLLCAIPSWSATLPDGFTELQYIENTGTQYITTNIVPTATDKISLEMEFVSITSSGKTIMGARDAAASGAGINFAASDSSMTLDFFGTRYNISEAPELNKIYKYEVVSKVGTIYKNGVSLGSNTFPAQGSLSLPLAIFGLNNGGNIAPSAHSYKIRSVVVEGKMNLIPAKNSSGVVGLYDTVSGNFFTNAGTGEFVAGPVVPENIYSQKFAGYIDGYFKSADNNRVIMSYPGNSILILNTEIGKTYTLKNTKTLMNASAGTRIFSSNVMPVVGTIYTPDQFYTVTDATTWVEGVTFTAKDIYTALLVRGDADGSANHDFAYISEGLELYEIYQAPIKIATTAYNTARFSPVVTELNDTIATIRSVVTNTINQTKAIADLQATKQTRPDENCPAGKKCLLVEDDNGQPHWYEIIESAYGLPSGYTALEYIQSTGTQYIDTGISITSGNFQIDADMQFTSIASPQYFGIYGGGYFGITDNYFAAGGHTTSKSADTQRHKFIFSSIIGTNVLLNLSIDGTNYNLSRDVSAGRVNLLVVDNSGTLMGATKAKLYSAQIYSNGTLVRDMIPAKNSSGVIGMYDAVSGTFFTNAGSGTFTAGPEI